MAGPDQPGPTAPALAPRSLGRWLPVLAPLLVAAGFALLGRPLRAAILLGVAVVAAALVALGVPIARGVERAVRAVVDAVVRVVLSALYLIVVVPAWVLDRVRPGRPSIERHRGWRTDRSEADAPTGRLLPRLAAVVGGVVLIVAVDYGIGLAWDSRGSDPAPTGSAGEGLQVGQRSNSDATSAADGTGTVDARASEPAMASSPWAAAYFQDLQQQGFVEWPFTGVKPVDFASPYINVDDWVRRSWTAPGSGARPEVWLFGGSGMFGEGQRDDHTIASELARLAADAGLPIDARNYGQRGWVHWQEMLLFEQRIAQVGAPDLAAFYDGPNDISAAGRYGDGVPLSLNDYVDGDAAPGVLSTQLLAPDDDGGESLPSQLWSEYAEHSAIRKVARWVGLIPEPAGAQEADDGTGRQELPESTFTSEEIVDVAIGTYLRGRELTDDIAARNDVEVAHFLQPQYYDDQPVWAYVQAQWPQPTTDLTDSVADRRDEVFIDGVHTNELGSQLIARAMWAQLRPAVQRWYDQHG